jgi:hypothetical protein
VVICLWILDIWLLSGRHFHGVVDLIQSTYVTSLVLEDSDLFKGSTATVLALGTGP